MRVQIPAWADRWMMGDRYGTVVKTKMIKPKTERDIEAYRKIMGDDGTVEMAWVKLSISGKTFVYPLISCTPAD